MITARIATLVGFEFGYASGYWLGASAYGLPDAGIVSYTQMLDRVETLVRSSDGTAIIADADTGYGGLLNVRHMVRGTSAPALQRYRSRIRSSPSAAAMSAASALCRPTRWLPA